MNSTIKTTALAALFMAIAVPAAAMTQKNMDRLTSMGFDAEVVMALSDKQIETIERTLHNGDDRDARQLVNSLLLNALMKQSMEN